MVMEHFYNHKLVFKDNLILDTNSNIEVMMDWEDEIMHEHAKVVSMNGGDILEIGFGMGISANYIQSFNINSHTIMELHPQIIPKLNNWKQTKKNIIVIEGDWYQNLDKLKKYDGIFFDTFLDDNARYTDILKDYLNPNGILTWYNPMINNNVFDLKCEYRTLEISPGQNNYNTNDKYSIPIYRNKI